ncbi:MAG: WYL domain-containing protein, partial [Phycisphaerae bacterium]|nr:WYL domain-containing protein [Phycisphaerae bacterium]
VRTLKVVRIKGLSPLGKTFAKPSDFSLAGHSKGAFGIFGTKETRKIRAEFSGWAATNVREIRWHPTQKITKDTGEKVIATFELGSTVEFRRWILGFGRYAKVLNPKELAESIREELSDAAEAY